MNRVPQPWRASGPQDGQPVAISLEPLARAVEQTADHVIITDKDGLIEYVNPAFEGFTGFRLEEIVGQTPRILNSGQHDWKFFQSVWQTILSGRVFRGVFVNKKKTGELYYEEKTIAPIRQAAGTIAHFVSTGRDITERRRIEEEREKLVRELKGALAKVKTLSGMLPICAWCKKVRDDRGFWSQIETYISSHSQTEFTHCICPACAQEMDPVSPSFK